MADSIKSPREKPAILLLGPDEDVKSIPQPPGFAIHLHGRENDGEKPRITGIVSDDPAVIEHHIRRVRQDSDLALLPLIVFSNTPLTKTAAVDGIYPPVFTEKVLSAILKEWEPLWDESNKFPQLSPHLSIREKTRLILLRYLLLRGLEKLEPVRDIHCPTGYCHPVASMILNAAGYDECEADLRKMEDCGLLQSAFADTVHTCCGCGHSHLNFREVCPRCGGANLDEERNIHHFRCGYVGCEADFPGMRCPKCRRRLKHIGVDYDLPSVSLRCLSCNEGFGEPLVGCLCFNCGRQSPVESTVKRVVRSYTLTSEGKRYAWDDQRDMPVKSEFGLLEFGVFKEFFFAQTAISQRAGKNLSLILVRGDAPGVSGASERQAGNHNNGLTGQLATVMKKILRGQDIMTASPAGGVLALAPDTSKEKAACIAERISSAFDGSSGDTPTVTYYEHNGITLEAAIEKLSVKGR